MDPSTKVIMSEMTGAGITQSVYYATGWTTDEKSLDSRQGQTEVLFSKMSTQAVQPTTVSYFRSTGALSSGVKHPGLET
jgi:hypothetical protein